MNNKAHLRPKDFDCNGDIIPMSWKEEKGDLISREALKKKFERLVDETIPYGGVAVNDMRELIDNAPTVDTTEQEKFAYNEGYAHGLEMKRKQGKWGKWVISEIQCPNCFVYFQTDCYSTEELKKCPNCGADMRGGGANE